MNVDLCKNCLRQWIERRFWYRVKKTDTCWIWTGPPCVNPKHLFLGTISDNIKDMWRKGRGKIPNNVGENNGNAKLTEKDIYEIRNTYKPYHYTQPKLAKKFNVSVSLIRSIVGNKLWSLK